MIQVNLIGRLGGDPETRFTQSAKGETKVTSFSLACNLYEKGGEQTVWWRITVWGDHPLITHLKKGSAVFVSGTMRKPSKWTDKNGETQFSLELTAKDVQFVSVGRQEKQEDGASNSTPAPAGAASAPNQTISGQAPQSADSSDDDLPF